MCCFCLLSFVFFCFFFCFSVATIVTVAAILLLVVSEFYYYKTVDVVYQYTVYVPSDLIASLSLTGLLLVQRPRHATGHEPDARHDHRHAVPV
jgi:hypothetical protein